MGLEEFAFVQLSEIYNVLPQARFGEASGWLMLAQALVAAIENVRLSQIQSDECAAVVAELGAWIKTFDSQDRLHLLRLKASFERVLRISSNFADESIALFQPRALERRASPSPQRLPARPARMQRKRAQPATPSAPARQSWMRL